MFLAVSKHTLCTFHSTLFAWKGAGTIKPSAFGYFVSDSVKLEVNCPTNLLCSDPYFACIKGIEKSAGISVKTQGR